MHDINVESTQEFRITYSNYDLLPVQFFLLITRPSLSSGNNWQLVVTDSRLYVTECFSQGSHDYCHFGACRCDGRTFRVVRLRACLLAVRSLLFITKLQHTPQIPQLSPFVSLFYTSRRSLSPPSPLPNISSSIFSKFLLFKPHMYFCSILTWHIEIRTFFNVRTETNSVCGIIS
jgi:hypothetical protein